MGTSIYNETCGRIAKDHPHACGDKCVIPLYACNSVGSSPRVWGQGHRFTIAEITARIIPTRVGTRITITRTFYVVKDHPHACGDKRLGVSDVVVKRGSSPRVWGQVSLSRKLGNICGIIPTRVGTSNRIPHL